MSRSRAASHRMTSFLYGFSCPIKLIFALHASTLTEQGCKNPDRGHSRKRQSCGQFARRIWCKVILNSHARYEWQALPDERSLDHDRRPLSKSPTRRSPIDLRG
jgi:hypothetical protein